MRNSKWLVVGALIAVAGCRYDPKHDLEEFRAPAEQKLAQIEKAGEAVKALPPLTADTLKFAEPSKLRFTDGPGGPKNAVIIHQEELTDFAGTKIYDRIVSEQFHLAPMKLLRDGEDPDIPDMNKEKVTWRMHQLLDVEYMLVLRVAKRVAPEVVGNSRFNPGAVAGDAILCELADVPRIFGGFMWAEGSSSTVDARVSANDRERADIDRMNAVRKDMDQKAEKQIHEKAKAALKGAVFPTYW